MCSIFVLTGKGIPLKEAERAFYATVSRGPDMSVFEETERGYVGFHRLAIMGLNAAGMQPFYRGKSIAVCNGELYGFRAIREKLEEAGETFVSDSDCEILLPLYARRGCDVFAMLDAEFACVIYDGTRGEYIAARDPIGIRPLYYCYLPDGSIAFASEPKNLVPIASGSVMPFPPGHYWRRGKFYRYRDMTVSEPVVRGDLDTVCGEIRTRLTEGVRKRLDADAPAGFLLSGGLDSSLVCAIAQRILGRPIRTFAIGMAEDAIDLKYARAAASFIGSEHTEFLMTREEVIAALPEVIAALASYDITTVRASMGMYLLCKKIRASTDVRVLLTGEVSDELFGYKYTDFAPSPQAFCEEAKKRVRELHMYDVLRADRCISVHSMEARVPFGDLAFVDYVMRLDPAMKMNTCGIGKYLLRRAFAQEGPLPDAILWREKAAFSDAVGHSMVNDLKAYAETCYGDDWREIAARFSHATPFTKESLLYREIFERYYPGQGEMIAGFWMPNRSWKGCDVDDPSARVLANYGRSGE